MFPEQLRRLPLGRRVQKLGDLDRVQRGALAEVVAREEEGQAALDGRVAADPADEDVVDPGGLAGDGNSSRRTDGAAASSSCARAAESRLLGLEPDRLGVADHHRHAHAGRLDRELRELHDLPRLRAELRLLVELLAVELPVHTEVVCRPAPRCASRSIACAPAPETDW